MTINSGLGHIVVVFMFIVAAIIALPVLILVLGLFGGLLATVF